MVADAQSTFTERLQRSTSGEGKITVTQDKSIDELVNGKTVDPVQPTQKKQTVTTPVTSATAKQEKKEQEKKEQTATLLEPDTQTATPDTIDTRKKVMKGYKVNGFRVQVFAGGNSRNDRLKAERIGNEIKSLFPEEPIYVHFYSPRWICRMGNYRTYEEAHQILRNVKELGYQSAIIVKGKITVQYP